MKLLLVAVASISLIACGGGSGSDGESSSPAVDSKLGTYSAEITSGGSIVRSLELVIETDQAVTSGIAEDTPFYQLRDGDNLFSRYRHMRNAMLLNTTNHFLEGYSETEAAYYSEASHDSLQDCLDNISGSAQVYSKISISQPKFTGGGSGTTLTACKLK